MFVNTAGIIFPCHLSKGLWHARPISLVVAEYFVRYRLTWPCLLYWQNKSAATVDSRLGGTAILSFSG